MKIYIKKSSYDPILNCTLYPSRGKLLSEGSFRIKYYCGTHIISCDLTFKNQTFPYITEAISFAQYLITELEGANVAICNQNQASISQWLENTFKAVQENHSIGRFIYL